MPSIVRFSGLIGRNRSGETCGEWGTESGLVLVGIFREGGADAVDFGGGESRGSDGADVGVNVFGIHDGGDGGVDDEVDSV